MKQEGVFAIRTYKQSQKSRFIGTKQPFGHSMKRVT
jgi:hypothetical protein